MPLYVKTKADEWLDKKIDQLFAWIWRLFVRFLKTKVGKVVFSASVLVGSYYAYKEYTRPETPEERAEREEEEKREAELARILAENERHERYLKAKESVEKENRETERQEFLQRLAIQQKRGELAARREKKEEEAKLNKADEKFIKDSCRESRRKALAAGFRFVGCWWDRVGKERGLPYNITEKNGKMYLDIFPKQFGSNELNTIKIPGKMFPLNMDHSGIKSIHKSKNTGDTLALTRDGNLSLYVGPPEKLLFDRVMRLVKF